MMGVFDLFSWLFGAKREGERKLRQRERSFKQRASERKKEAGSLRKEEQVLKRLERWESHELKDEKKAAKIVKRLVRYIMEARNLLRELQEEHVYHHLSREGRFVAVRSLFDRSLHLVHHSSTILVERITELVADMEKEAALEKAARAKRVEEQAEEQHIQKERPPGNSEILREEEREDAQHAKHEQQRFSTADFRMVELRREDLIFNRYKQEIIDADKAFEAVAFGDGERQLSAVAFQLHHYESVLRSLMAALKDGSLKVSREKTELSHEQEQLHLDRGEERQEIKADHLAAKEAHESRSHLREDAS
jgi:hypothetical protein